MSSRRFFFKELPVTASAFSSEPDVEFGFTATKIIITNDTKKKVDFTFVKQDEPSKIDGTLYAKDGPISFEGLSELKCWFKCDEGQPTRVRIWAWGSN